MVVEQEESGLSRAAVVEERGGAHIRRIAHREHPYGDNGGEGYSKSLAMVTNRRQLFGSPVIRAGFTGERVTGQSLTVGERHIGAYRA